MKHDTMGSSRDPHMKSPTPKYFIIIVVVALLAIFVAPKIYEIYQENLHDTSRRADNGEATSNTIRDK